MIIPSSIWQLYDEWLPFLKEVEIRVESTLLPFCRKEGFIFEGRLKSPDSLAEKIESGRYSSWEKLDDIYACTVAVPLAHDEKIVREKLSSLFDVSDSKERGAIPKPPDVFRFDSTRVIARLRKPPDAQIDKEISIFNILFEVQIKSLFEFAWSKTTHALTYKSSLVDWKRHRLTAHLKAAVEQADFLLVGFEQAAQLVTDGWSHEIKDKSALRTLFQELVRSKQIPTEFVPKDWSRFIDNVYTVLQVLSGERPTGRDTRPIRSLALACDVLRDYFSSTDEKMIPRSLSLFQIVLGVLCSSGKFKGHYNGYYLPRGEAFTTIFPHVVIPGQEFTF
jgi:ppGpp synthetase/RelA/SpoT-type nucleotidyltranferase